MLVIVAAAFWLVTGLPARQFFGDETLVHGGVAVMLSLIPGMLTLFWANWAYGQNPHQEVLAILGATGVRLFGVLLLSLVLYMTVEFFHRPAFLFWVAGAYCFLLTVEVLLLLRGRAIQEQAKSGTGV